MKVYLVIGDADMGKSSVLRHLVAFSNGNGKSIRTKTLATIHGTIEIGFYGYQALQETAPSPGNSSTWSTTSLKKSYRTTSFWLSG